MSDDLYHVLNVPPDATTDAIEKAYRSMASRWHPDLHPAARRTQAEEQMKRINAAAELLLDSQRRAAYDAERNQRASASASPLADSTTCAFHPDRPRLHLCVCCRKALCVDCTQTIGGWPWCVACAATSQTFVSSAPIFGDNSIAQEAIRREQYSLSLVGKINLALSVVASALWLFAVWGPGFIYTPFAIGLVIVGVLAASGAFHLALLRTLAPFWNARKETVPKIAPSLLAICLILMTVGGANSASQSMAQIQNNLTREQAAAQRLARQEQEQKQQRFLTQRIEEIRREFFALFDPAPAASRPVEEKVAEKIIEGLSGEKAEPANAVNESNIDFTHLAAANAVRAEELAEEYLHSEFAEKAGRSETCAMFLSFLVYQAIHSDRFGDEDNQDTEAKECLTIAARPAFKVYCLYYQAKRIEAKKALPLDDKIAEWTKIQSQLNNLNIPASEQNVASLRDQVRTLLKEAQDSKKVREKKKAKTETDKALDEKGEKSPKSEEKTDISAQEEETPDSSQNPPTENLDEKKEGNP